MGKSAASFPVDSHVHIYPGFSLEDSLSGAAGHMENYWGSSRTGCLLLTETRDCNVFASLPDQSGDWRITATSEPVSRLATHKDGAQLAVIAGRQFITSEGLEVLGLGVTEVEGNGDDLDKTLAAIRKQGCIAVLPWGVGKWTGQRGALIDKTIAEKAGERDVFLADSGVRSKATRRPARFAIAEATGWRVLAGTDPLPLTGQWQRVGAYGFLMPGKPDHERPFGSLAGALRELRVSPQVYGELESVPRFVQQQIAMQVQKRVGLR